MSKVAYLICFYMHCSPLYGPFSPADTIHILDHYLTDPRIEIRVVPY